jgi:hypothetical protein
VESIDFSVKAPPELQRTAGKRERKEALQASFAKQSSDLPEKQREQRV